MVRVLVSLTIHLQFFLFQYQNESISLQNLKGFKVALQKQGKGILEIVSLCGVSNYFLGGQSS